MQGRGKAEVASSGMPTGSLLSTTIATQTEVLPSGPARPAHGRYAHTGAGRGQGGLGSARSTGSKRLGGKQVRPPWRPLGRGPTHRILL